MDKKEIQEKIESGWIRINTIFEVVGNPKDHVVNSLKSYMQNIKTDGQIEVLNEDYAEVEDIGQGLFSTFVEADLLVLGLEKLTWICYNFTPASIEIVEPLEFTFSGQDLQNWINDILSKLHEVGNVSKQINSQNKLLVKNMNRLVKNSILMCVEEGYDTPKEIEEKVGIPFKQLKDFFEALMREGKLDLHEEQYKRITDDKSS